MTRQQVYGRESVRYAEFSVLLLPNHTCSESKQSNLVGCFSESE
jgi:hypothetical protein